MEASEHEAGDEAEHFKWGTTANAAPPTRLEHRVILCDWKIDGKSAEVIGHRVTCGRSGSSEACRVEITVCDVAAEKEEKPTDVVVLQFHDERELSRALLLCLKGNLLNFPLLLTLTLVA